jgi:iron complex outermembrane receptor protein
MGFPMIETEGAIPSGTVQHTPRLPGAAALIGLLALLLLSTPAFADAKTDAKRHYRDGMALIAAGQLERGIEELKAAYAIKPHPDVLYNVARAYVDLGNIPEALRYFRLYVATDPEDRATVEAVMARLTAAISKEGGGKKPEEGGAAPAPRPPPAAGTAVSGDAQSLIQQLQALLAQAQGGGGATLPGGAPALPPAPDEEEMFAAAEITASTKATAREIASTLQAERGGEDLFEEQVVTAGVRASAESKAPASLTVITEEEIRLSGATTVPELLRRVPGMEVAEMNPSDVNISIRGFNRRVSNKVLVLVDGRSVYQDFLGDTLWPILDVAIPDIARIEVIRGPGSALYGANAFSGVVNIITKTGEESPGPRVWVTGGDHNTVQGGVSAGGRSGKLTYKLNGGYDRADKWTQDAAPDQVAVTPQFSQPGRSREVERASFSAQYDAGKVQATVGGGYDNFGLEVVSIAALRSFFNTGQSGFARGEISSGQTKVKAFWNALRMTSGPEYASDGLPALQSTIRSDVIDVTGQTGVDFKLAGQHHFNFGAGWRYKSVDWGFLALQADGTHRFTENHVNAFLQEEWQMGKTVSLVLSYRVDRHPLLAQYSITPGGLVQSPRGTLIWEFKPDQILRFTVGTAFRVPSFLESYTNVHAVVPNEPAVDVQFAGDQQLKPEQIVQTELGYRGKITERLQPEVVVYAERITDLISDGKIAPTTPDTAIDPLTGRYVAAITGFRNEPSEFFGLGAELGFKYTPSDGVDFNVNYSYERIQSDCFFGCTPLSGSTVGEELAVAGNTPQHKLNLVASWRTKFGIDLATDVHYVSGVTWAERSFDASKLTNVNITAYPIDAYTLINGRIGYRAIKDKLDVSFAIYNALGDDHREHPFGNKIGRRFTFTASGNF